MRILIANDDGIYSPGIAALAKIATRFGDVRVVAPDVERSSAGHSITSSRPLRYRRTRVFEEIEAYRVDGTPADCVALGVHGWDHVDLVLTQQVEGGGEGPPLRVSETIVRNIRVLATDQRITDKGDDGKTEVKTFSNVTLEVTPRIAEKIAVAQSMGQLSLSLRSIADNNAELERAIASGDVKVEPGATPADERRVLLSVANRPMDTNTTYTTGGDVSRFQRRTVPARAPNAGQQVGDSLTQFANALMGKSNSEGAQASSGPVSGPSVRVARGNTVTVVPVGAR